MDRSDIIEKLYEIEDPELGMSIVDLGLVYGVGHKQGRVAVSITLTYPGCPFGPALIEKIHTALKGIKGVRSVTVDLVWEPPWEQAMIASDLREELRFSGRIR